ncbi:hypothetical protein ACFQZ4_13285 [Catellatospora coxensis]|uniref:Uncharacterized protein n=1 Tax=Catellatospora coxensis TaxID=310354 RepID=A0A8J3P8J8_9ACTN|nr:hypothetical protein Cco03nite_49360 [Catellatospora coxensis]
MLVDFGGERLEVTAAGGLTASHAAQIRQAVYDGRLLRFPDPSWRCAYLSAGEEKACFGIRDADGRMFVLEVIDERTYLNGRFVGGAYSVELLVPSASISAASASACSRLSHRRTSYRLPLSSCRHTTQRREPSSGCIRLLCPRRHHSPR